jgi:dTDP-glucose 4,6-dehydratase
MSGDIVLVTGGAGFIGSAVVRHLIRTTDSRVINVDQLTYAADLANVAEAHGHERYCFERCDIRRPDEVERIFLTHRPTAVMHLAAETHVDRSIDDPLTFVDTNITGTATLLEAARRYWRALPGDECGRFRFHHVSTDEVFGSLAAGAFDESSSYRPNSPYAASKAAADHLVRAWHTTYGLPVVISNCSNNYGPYQYPEKFIPLMILNALAGRPLPVYGDGTNVREWIYVDDHADALWTILRRGRIGESYNVGGSSEARNIDVAQTICDLIDALAKPLPTGKARRDLITFVEDRPGHDFRYAMNAAKLGSELGWRPAMPFADGLRRTVEWYAANQSWWESRRDESTRRLGVANDDGCRG